MFLPGLNRVNESLYLINTSMNPISTNYIEWQYKLVSMQNTVHRSNANLFWVSASLHFDYTSLQNDFTSLHNGKTYLHKCFANMF
jgi:hypothetical protein